MHERAKGIRWQVICFFLLPWLCHSVSGQIHYSIVEEMRKGSVVGNLATDIGMNIKDLSARKLRIVSDVSEKYFNLNPENGDLSIAERIDRETLCGAAADCVLSFDAVAENPLNIFSVRIEILDINDNPPTFIQERTVLKMSENTLPGAKFNLKSAIDLDIGINSLKGYRLSANQHFALGKQRNADVISSPELVLEKPLDREAQSSYELILSAFDGGNPAQTGTAVIQISVTDFNDNTPVFTQNIYKVEVKESVPLNLAVLQVSATDADEGVNAQITYSFDAMLKKNQPFSINASNGEVKTKQRLDYEVTKHYEFTVEAKDGGGLVSNAKVLIEILDENDNAPEISITSLSSPVPEDTPIGTVVSLIAVRDKDSGLNGEVQCQVIGDVPFQLISSASNFFKIATKSSLDREKTASYNITIRASDKGSPPQSSAKIIRLDLSDVNDNAPAFEKSAYSVFIPENNSPGVSILSIQAVDMDSSENAKVTYSVVGNNDGKGPMPLHVSINSETGVLYAQKVFDYEQDREFNVRIVATDGGSPPMNTSTSLKVHVVDQNDNPPVILYPATNMDGPLFEMVPWSSEKGSLVTKVVAVDADSGHNAWLTYSLQSSEPSIFTIDQHTGEIRTLHAFRERDALKYKVVVIVKDNGFPPLSASATLNLVVAESFQQVVPEIVHQSSKHESQSNLQIYLVIALASVSFLFMLTVIFAIVSKYRESKYSSSLGSISTNLYPTLDPRFISQFPSGTLQLPYSYDVCVTLDSRKNDFALLTPQRNVPVDHLIDADDSGIGNQSAKDSLLAENISCQQSQPNADWQFTQGQRPGPSGLQQPAGEPGVWPNNQFETERLQAMILASANEAAEGTSGAGVPPGTMGLSARYGPQFTLQHVPDYRQNIYIPGTTTTLTNAAGKRDNKGPSGNKKKSGKKDKK